MTMERARPQGETVTTKQVNGWLRVIIGGSDTGDELPEEDAGDFIKQFEVDRLIFSRLQKQPPKTELTEEFNLTN
jgi:hypothetical protein